VKKLAIIFVFICFNLVQAGGFDNLGVHSRVIGIGGVYYGIGDAPYSVFYNPAGLAHLKRIEINSTYSNLFPGLENESIYYLTGSGVLPFEPIGSFGAGVTFLKTNHWQENTFILSYARTIFTTFGVGGSVKILRWSASAAPGEALISYFGLTFDAGAYYTIEDIFGQGSLRLGAAAQDITQPSIAKNDSKDSMLPIKLAVGISYFSPTYDYLIAIDGVKEDEAYYLKFGAEFLGMRIQVLGVETGFYVRGGYNGIVNKIYSKQSALNGGFGIFVENFKFDYAYVHQLEIESIGGSHKLSIGYHF
jgi:hypothetical protein